jgi:hypothetical protein
MSTFIQEVKQGAVDLKFKHILTGSAIVVPLLDTGEMMPVLMGMLGLGAMRTYEKKQGVQRDK